jgi:hypothetical protein
MAIVISLLFGLAAFAALTAICSSLLSGSWRVRAILAELAGLERRAHVTRARAVLPTPRAVLRPALAAA